MNKVTRDDLQKLYLPPKSSHKGQNGKLLIIGGSHLFHAASLWALKVASRIVDLVHYSSVPENNRIVHELKKEFRDGIVVPRGDIENYIKEDDCILIGPGMVRAQRELTTYNLQLTTIKEIEKIKDEGIQTAALTNYLLAKYPHKRWVIDAGALQMMDVNLIPENAILTPHRKELFKLLNKDASNLPLASLVEEVEYFVKKFHCIVLLKGETDICCSPDKCQQITGGNSGMTKGGTGDVLAGLVAALACKNDAYLAAITGSFINKKAGERLFKRAGHYFNASDLADEIPGTLKDFKGI